MKTSIAIIVALLFFSVPQGAEAKKWVGVLAVTESPLVIQTILDNGNDPARYGPALRALLDAGRIQPAAGRFCLRPFQSGRGYDRKECYFTRTGIWTRWAPNNMVESGKAMCAEAPRGWSLIVGQRRYPASAGRLWNCYDFGPEAAEPGFASTKETAAMIVMIKAAGD